MVARDIRVAIAIAGGGTARPTTPTPPRVRSAPSRAYPTSALQDEKAFSRGRGAAVATSAATRDSSTVTVATLRIRPTYSARALRGKP